VWRQSRSGPPLLPRVRARWRRRSWRGPELDSEDRPLSLAFELGGGEDPGEVRSSIRKTKLDSELGGGGDPVKQRQDSVAQGCSGGAGSRMRRSTGMGWWTWSLGRGRGWSLGSRAAFISRIVSIMKETEGALFYPVTDPVDRCRRLPWVFLLQGMVTVRCGWSKFKSFVEFIGPKLKS
jgi:hypothetical protein